jgi:hypothetical protein
MMSPEEYLKQHQKAFRTAFDFLTSHFPPGLDPEWWEQAARDVSAESIANGENKLVIGLLIGVYDYLEDEYKLRRDRNGKTDS